MDTNLTINLGKIELKNPVILASGTAGYGEELSEIYDISKLGAIVTKGISLKPSSGNNTPRIIETASGIINAIGLENVGVDNFIKEKLPFLRKKRTTVIANVYGATVEDYVAVAIKLDGIMGISALELNISCPNISKGGLSFGTDPISAAKVTEAVKKVSHFPLIVKLSPQITDIKTIARAVTDAGADIISLINTFPAMAIDIKTKKPILANQIGGLSGPAIKPIALKLVRDVATAVNIPIIGIGGIVSAKDAIEFILAGASAIQIGSANFTDPNIGIEIIDGIKEYMKEQGIADITSLIGYINK